MSLLTLLAPSAIAYSQPAALGASDTRQIVRSLSSANPGECDEIRTRLRKSGNVAWSTVTALECVGAMDDRLSKTVQVRDKQGAKMYAYFLRRVAKWSSKRSEFTEFRAMEIENRDLCKDVQRVWRDLQAFEATARGEASKLVDLPDVLTPIAERVRTIMKSSRRASRRGAVLRSLDGHLVRELATDLNAWAARPDERDVAAPAMRLLARIPDLVDVALVAPAAAHSDPVVRRTAFRLLAAVGSAEAVDVLVDRVAAEEGVPARDLLWYLRELSGEKDRRTSTEWHEWWDAYRPAWKRTGGDVAAVGEVARTVYSRYFGLELHSARVLFVIDHSGSMSYWVGYRDGLDDSAAGRSPDKMTIAKRELVQAIAALDERTTFNILAYGDEFDSFASRPVRASDTRREKAAGWIEKLTPDGVTNLSGTLLEAMANTRPGKGVRDDAIADTIVVLSDGVPNCGPIAYPLDTLAELRRLNVDHMVTIHAIFLGVDGDEAFMRSLAADHGGKFVHYKR